MKYTALASLSLGLVLNVSLAQAAAPVAPESQTVSPDRFSPLSRIDRSNVARLRPVLTFRFDERGAEGGAPLVVGTTLYLLTLFPHVLFALDLTQPQHPVRWQFAPESDSIASGLACCNRLEHGPVYGDGRIYFSTLDGRVIAVDPTTGKPVWNVRIADPRQGETLVSAPVLSGDRLLIGNAGDDFGVRGWIVALDPATGREIWKHYSTGPDLDVGGPHQDGAGARQTSGPATADLGVMSWPQGVWQHGGGSVTAPVLSDLELHLLFHNTGPPAPWNPQQREGENRWTGGVFARDPQTGAVRWFAPLHSHSLYPRPADIANIAVDAPWEGQDRKLLLHADGDGRLYVLDRSSGELLASDPLPAFASEAAQPHFHLQARAICPAWIGAVGGNPAMASATGLLYLPINRLCMDFEARQASYLQGTPYLGANVRVYGAPGKSRGSLVAWDFHHRRPAWTVTERFPVGSDVLASAGGLVFYGTLDGLFKAVDADSGKTLWQWHTDTGIISQPVSYRGPDGQQYIAVIAGLGGPYGIASQYWIDRRDATAARGLAQAIADLAAPKDPRGTLYVFGLQ